MSNNPITRRSLSLQAAIDKSNLGSDDPVLVLVDIYIVDRITGEQTGEVIRIVNTAQEVSSPTDEEGGVHMVKEDVNYQTNYYIPAAFDVKLREAAGEIPQVTLSMHDISGVVRAKMDLYGGGVGFNVRVSVVWRSTLALPPAQQRAEIQEMFQVVSASTHDRDVSLTLGASSLLAIDFPRRRQTKDFCQWQYKGLGCTYSGPLATCDRTLKGDNGCEAHDNVGNFGGFPGIVPRGTIR